MAKTGMGIFGPAAADGLMAVMTGKGQVANAVMHFRLDSNAANLLSFDLIERTVAMPAVTVRKLSEETHRALKMRAARNGRSTEAEMRLILDAAVKPPERIKLGSLLALIGEETGGFDTEGLRDRTISEPVSLA